MYRLVVDFPMGDDQSRAIEDAKVLMDVLVGTARGIAPTIPGLKELKYRLQEDTDRSPKNYLSIDENGHAGNKKISVEL